MSAPLRLSLAPRPCPICATSDHSVLFAESNVDTSKLDAFAFASRKLPEYMHWRLLECRRCDLLYASPAPQPENLSLAYRDAAFDSAREARYAAQSYAQLLPRLARQLPDVDGALDIGTGDGVFLEKLIEAGFTNVAGVEPSSAPIDAAAPHVRPLIKQALFRAEDFTPGSFSLVTCFQTLEHLADPMSMASAVYRLLKPGGAAFFVGHNRRALSAKILGRRSPIFDLEHLQLFSPMSLRRLMAATGFVDLDVGPLRNQYPIAYWARLLPFPRRIKNRLIAFMGRTGVGRLPMALPAGNLWAVGFKSRL